MARQLRHHYAGGWYHTTARGMGRREIFADDRERFVELQAGMERVKEEITLNAERSTFNAQG